MMARSCSWAGRKGDHMSLSGADFTVSVSTPTFPIRPDTSSLRLNVPILPVTVVGKA